MLNVLVVSRTREMIDVVDSMLRRHPGLRVTRKLVVNGHTDPLHEVSTLPDALILHLGESSRGELDTLAARPAGQRPPLIVVGSAGDAALMRLAMQAGARDLLPLPLVEADLVAALKHIERDHQHRGARAEGSLLAFMNAKGGCGATFLACTVAHMLVNVAHRRVTLMDLDLQFGTIPMYFDLFPKRGTLQALENLAGLDEMAFNGYLVEEPSGLKILGNAAEDALPMRSPAAPQVGQLISLALAHSDFVVADLPRQIDPLAALVAERAQTVVLVVQQSVATLRDATRLFTHLRRDLGVSRDRILVVVNRYEKRAAIGVADICTALGCEELVLVPNAFETVAACVDTGTPLLHRARSAAVTRAIIGLQDRLSGREAEQPGLLARTLSGLLKARST
jgi:pilus assembly protein CpaE